MAALIVNDRPSARKVQRLWLKAQARWRDESIVECATLDEAIQASREFPIDFVSLDLNLDEKDHGIATLERFLRESNVPARRIYVNTADSDNFALVRQCLDLGVADVNNPADDLWRQPPQIFSEAQLVELQRQIAASIGAEVAKKIESEFARLQAEQEQRDKLKQAEGIMTALRVVAGVLATALGTWLLSFAPLAVKTLVLSLISGGKQQ